jgi:hypothetical protein
VHWPKVRVSSTVISGISARQSPTRRIQSTGASIVVLVDDSDNHGCHILQKTPPMAGKKDTDTQDTEPIDRISMFRLRRDAAVFSAFVGLFLVLDGMVLYLVSFGSVPQEALIFRTVACILTVLGVVIAYRAQAGFEYIHGDDVSNMIIKLVRLAPRAVCAETYYIALIATIILLIVYFVCGTFCSSAPWFWHFQIVWAVVMVAAAVRFCLAH